MYEHDQTDGNYSGKGNIPGKGGSQGSPLLGERAHAESAQLKSLPVAGMHSVRGELV